MSTILPSRIQDLLDFMDQHAQPWVTNAAGIGVAPATAATFKTQAIAARDAYTAKLTADEAARIAAVNLSSAVRTARTSAADIIRTVKAFAQSSADPDTVYNLALIPAPAKPTPAAPPGTPGDIRAVLNTDGSITLRWKATNPKGTSGTIYNVRRKVEGESVFTFIGATGTRSFIDGSLPAGPANAVYTIQGQRSTVVGQPSSPFTVLFGGSGPGMVIAAQFSGMPEGVSGKLAA